MALPIAYSLQIKRTFLNFLQQYFEVAVDNRYKWSSNLHTTNIIIADKHGVDKPVNEKRPMIILSRSTTAPGMITIGQRLSRTWKNNKESYLDLFQGVVTFNCLAKSGLVAEEIAHIVMMALLGFRGYLKTYDGIHQILGVQIGEESTVSVDTSSTLINVPVSVRFTKNIAFTPAPELTSGPMITLTCSGTTSYWYEALQYDIYKNSVTTYTPITSGCTASIYYLDAITLSGITETLSGINGVETTFILSRPVYSYYPMLHKVDVDYTVSGLTYSYSGYSGIEPNTAEWISYSGYFSGMITT